MENLYEALPAGQAEEQFLELLRRPGLRIERIVSTGQVSPPGFWYDQPQGEWIVVLQGRASIVLDGDAALPWRTTIHSPCGWSYQNPGGLT